MAYYGKYKSYDEKLAARKARTENHKKVRAEARKKADTKAKNLIFTLKQAMKAAGLKQIELADFSGISPSAIIRIERTHHTSLQLSTFVAIANACGCELELKLKKPSEDEFRQFRTVRLVDVEGK